MFTPEQLKELRDTLKSMVQDGQKSQDEAVNQLKTAVDTMKAQVQKLAGENAIIIPGLDEKEAGKFQFKNCMAQIKAGKNLLDLETHEGEVLRETQKAQTVDPVSAGGVFVPTIVSDRIVDLALSMTVLNQLSIQRISVEGNNKLTIPTITQDPSASWLGELADIPESSMAFGSVPIEPWKVAAYVGASNEILSQKNVNMEQLIMTSMARQIALAIDFAGLRGTGSGADQPLGIINDPTVQTYRDATTYADGDPANWYTFDKLQETLEATNTFIGQLAYVSRPEVYRSLRRQTISQFSGQPQAEGHPLFSVPFMSQAQLESTVGYPMKSTTQLPTLDIGTKTGKGAELIFGDFSQMILATYGNLELASDTSPLFKQYGTVMRAVQRVDMRVLRGDSFVVATGVDFDWTSS